jgi:hypothetical protein
MTASSRRAQRCILRAEADERPGASVTQVGGSRADIETLKATAPGGLTARRIWTILCEFDEVDDAENR